MNRHVRTAHITPVTQNEPKSKEPAKSPPTLAGETKSTSSKQPPPSETKQSEPQKWKTGYDKPPLVIGYRYDEKLGCKVAFIESGGPANQPQQQQQNNNSGDVNNINNNVNAPVTINMFGHEDMSHITPVVIFGILNPMGKITSEKGLHTAAIEMIRKLATDSYNNYAKPANSTAYSRSAKADTAIARGKDCWESRPMAEIISNMAARTIDQAFDNQPNPGQHGIPIDQNLDNIADILRYLAAHENDIRANPPECLREIPFANRGLLKAKLGKLPQPGDK